MQINLNQIYQTIGELTLQNSILREQVAVLQQQVTALSPTPPTPVEAPGEPRDPLTA